MSPKSRRASEFSATDVEGLIRDYYGLSGSIRKLNGEENQNFQIRTESGDDFVLKISPPHESANILDLQNQALEHLAKQRPEVMWPTVVPTLIGEPIFSVEDKSGHQVFVRMLTYLPGDLLVQAQPHSPKLLVELGRFFGELDKALVGFSHPAACHGSAIPEDR